MRKFGVVAAAAVFLLASGAAAAEPEEQEASKAEKKVCKSEKMTGSLTRVRRICKTQREWDLIAEAARKGVSDLDRQSSINSGS
jgi:hypothetical protein